MRYVCPTLTLLCGLLVCGGCRHKASKTEIAYFGIQEQSATKAEVRPTGGATPFEVTGPELRALLDAFVEQNLIAWGDYGNAEKLAEIVFFKNVQEMGTMKYYAGSIIRQGGVFVKMKNDPIAPLLNPTASAGKQP